VRVRVDPAMLHSGADESHRASGHAGDGANALSMTPPTAGIFGDFEAAEAFHEAITAAHAAHVKALEEHRDTLHNLGTRTHHAAYSFTEMDDHNAKVLREV
jgi:uncharacterized protein (UPF0262 family)